MEQYWSLITNNLIYALVLSVLSYALTREDSLLENNNASIQKHLIYYLSVFNLLFQKLCINTHYL